MVMDSCSIMIFTKILTLNMNLLNCNSNPLSAAAIRNWASKESWKYLIIYYLEILILLGHSSKLDRSRLFVNKNKFINSVVSPAGSICLSTIYLFKALEICWQFSASFWSFILLTSNNRMGMFWMYLMQTCNWTESNL